jgi:hypothetical protein
MITLHLEFIFELTCELAPALEIGATPEGFRRVVPIISGTFEGPLLRGVVLPGGADWQIVRPDGVTELQARYVLRTHEGVLIQVRNRGLRHGTPEVLARLANDETVDPSEYYCRTTPIFEAPAGPYEWLNRYIFVATAARLPLSIRLRFFRVA